MGKLEAMASRHIAAGFPPLNRVSDETCGNMMRRKCGNQGKHATAARSRSAECKTSDPDFDQRKRPPARPRQGRRPGTRGRPASPSLPDRGHPPGASPGTSAGWCAHRARDCAARRSATGYSSTTKGREGLSLGRLRYSAARQAWERPSPVVLKVVGPGSVASPTGPRRGLLPRARLEDLAHRDRDRSEQPGGGGDDRQDPQVVQRVQWN